MEQQVQNCPKVLIDFFGKHFQWKSISIDIHTLLTSSFAEVSLQSREASMVSVYLEEENVFQVLKCKNGSAYSVKCKPSEIKPENMDWYTPLWVSLGTVAFSFPSLLYLPSA